MRRTIRCKIRGWDRQGDVNVTHIRQIRENNLEVSDLVYYDNIENKERKLTFIVTQLKASHSARNFLHTISVILRKATICHMSI